jgi:4-amino-4-deoxy-L-arabinose transferase-like glycosyltransferase/cytochrome c-type biogenesis protein CcmH/NrfG
MSANRQSPTVNRQSSAVAWFLIIAGVAFLLRLIHLLQWRHNAPQFFSPQMDSLYHHEWALAIAAGRQFIADAFFRAPLYPYFLGLLYKLFGANLMVVRIIQALIGSASCGLTYLLARRLVDKSQIPSTKSQTSTNAANPKSAICNLKSEICNRPGEGVARAAGFVMAAYPLAIWFDGELLLEGLLTFLVLLGFVLLLRSRDTDRQWWLPGIVFGLAAIARPNLLAFLAVLPVWLFLERGRTRPTGPTRRTALARLAQLWGAAALVILPVTIRNYVVSGQFVPIAWQAGTNFYIGNSPESDGVTAIVPGTRGSWWGGYNDVKRLAEEAAGRALKGAEIDRYWMARGAEFWRRQPGRALGLLLRKTFLWFAGYEVGNDSNLYEVKRHSFINYLLFNSRFLKFPFGVLLPLALVGVWLARRQWRRLLPLYLFIGAYSVSFIAFFVTSRYRMPMIPIAAILASVGLVGLVGPVRLRGKELIWPLAIALAAFLLFNANLAGAGREASLDQNHFVAALGLHQQGRDAEALVELRRALATDSATNVLSLEATLLGSQGDIAGAERAARAAVRLHPLDAEAYGMLGNVFANAGQLDSAAAYFEVVLKRDPYSLQAWNNLGNIALSRQDYASARRYYEGALKIRPTFTLAMFHLGLCDYYEGRVEQAHARWQEILKLDPSFAKARAALEQLK